MLGRPEQSEAAAYHFTYIDQVPGGDPQAVLLSQLESWLKPLSELTEGQSLYRYAPDKWSIREVLNHITDTERVFAFRALWFARGFDTPLPNFDQNIAVAGARADHVSWEAHVEEFRRVRLSTIALFANLPTDSWMRGGVASGHYVSVRALCFVTAGHFAHHCRILEERYLPAQL